VPLIVRIDGDDLRDARVLSRRAFLNSRRHAYLWYGANRHYGEIMVPVLVIYGDRDWSRSDERQHTINAIPGAKAETVANGGHFLSLDQPERLATLIKSFG